ncbi:putative esterase [Calothrix parasitica NIES-267]|uniref:Putative esterase n=1 Tax=Calothrix parasitica NIES-267 TaxID=1973488 RepID=A0A1Z4M169_9CYAN|nr:putative esterase [Calothrix parasitica NIES-267]
MSDLTNALNRIFNWLEKHPSEKYASVDVLQPRLSYEEIERRVADLAFELPEEVYELYQWKNGTYEAEVKQIQASEDALYVILGGANDYLSGDFSEPIEPVTVVVNVITSLYNAGARYFLVPNVPDLGNTPLSRTFSDEEIAFLTDISNRHNDLLEKTLRKLKQHLADIKIKYADFRALGVDVANNPKKFGLTNVTDSYLIGEAPNFYTASENADDYLFFDEIHLTTVGHLLIADALWKQAMIWK